MQLHYLDIHGVTHTIELFLNFHEFVYLTMTTGITNIYLLTFIRLRFNRIALRFKSIMTLFIDYILLSIFINLVSFMFLNSLNLFLNHAIYGVVHCIYV